MVAATVAAAGMWGGCGGGGRLGGPAARWGTGRGGWQRERAGRVGDVHGAL